MIPYQIFGLFVLLGIMFLYGAFLRADTGYWESPLFSGMATILFFMLSWWSFKGVVADGSVWTSAETGLFLGAIGLISFVNMIVRIIDGFGKNINFEEVARKLS